MLVAAGLALAAQVFATAVLFAFESHGVTVEPFSGLRPYVGEGHSGPVTALLWVGVLVAFLLNLQLRLAGVVALLRLRRWRLEPAQVFLLGGALAGPAVYLLVAHPGSSNQYFTRTGFAFGVLLSGWGFVELLDRAALTIRGRVLLGAGAASLALALTAYQLRFPAIVPPDGRPPRCCRCSAGRPPWWRRWSWWPCSGRGWSTAGPGWPAGARWCYSPSCWWPARRAWCSTRRRPGTSPTAGRTRWSGCRPPGCRRRWVRAHSGPEEVLATNVHCRMVVSGWCDARSFWLSGYAERPVLVEGWAFAPRMVGRPEGPYAPFWDAERLRANDAAFTAPTAAGLAELRDRYGVRWLVVDRTVGPESPDLAQLADLRHENTRMAVYRLR
ncbi:hypothetical protein [Micromonospora sp. 4G55]|uniref:hypothetical protein n=1 Tax=Micromonospora sp. 4G55 TaxID=2806102 RepID=UPI001A44CDCE|nr:hypothetical protein [Micromonospora sp. 4G55]MBM0258454.1 hypothetical protein [Micromonospora sp. 4G55]